MGAELGPEELVAALAERTRCRGRLPRPIADPGQEIALVGGPFDGADVSSSFTLYLGSVLLMQGSCYVLQPDGRRAVWVSAELLP